MNICAINKLWCWQTVFGFKSPPRPRMKRGCVRFAFLMQQLFTLSIFWRSFNLIIDVRYYVSFNWQMSIFDTQFSVASRSAVAFMASGQKLKPEKCIIKKLGLAHPRSKVRQSQSFRVELTLLCKFHC
jgi:hypothetical protein